MEVFKRQSVPNIRDYEIIVGKVGKVISYHASEQFFLLNYSAYFDANVFN